MAFSYKKLILLYILMIHSISAQTTCLKKQLVELVKVDKKSWIECVSPNSFNTIKATKNTYEIKIEPKILTSKDKKIYLFDLANKKNSFLNVLDYQWMHIDGNYSKAKNIALADRYYYQKEGNYAIKLDNNGSIYLPSLIDNLDLRSLKYLVLIIDNNSSVSLDSIRFTKEQSKAKKDIKNLSVWMWNTKNIDYDALSNSKIQRIYLQINNDFNKTIYRIKGKEIFGLDGNPENIFDFKRLKNDIIYLGKLKKKNSSIKGFQIDVEPYLIKNFQINATKYYIKYIHMVEELSVLAHKNGLLFSTVIPFWFNNVYVNDKPLAYTIINLSDEVVLMSYRSNFKDMINISREMLYYGDYMHKSIKIGIELKKIPNEIHTVYQQLKSTPCLSDGMFNPLCTPLKRMSTYTVKGESISFFGQYEKVKNILQHSINHPSFSGFVLHDYEEIDKLF